MLIVSLLEVLSVCSCVERQSNYLDYLFEFIRDELVGLGGASVYGVSEVAVSVPRL